MRCAASACEGALLTTPVASQKVARIRQVLGCDAHLRIVDEMARYQRMGRAQPRALKRGDRIAIVAPASPFNRDEFTRGVAEIERLGFVPTFEDSVFEKDSSYLAGSPEVRASAFMKHWSDPSVSALLAVRGGYGSVHLATAGPRSCYRAAQTVHRLQRQHLAAVVADLPVRPHRSWADDRRTPRRWSGYDQRSFLELVSGGRRLELAPEGLTVLREENGERTAVRRYDHAARGFLGTPFAFDPGWLACFSKKSTSAPYRIDRMLTSWR